MGESELPGMQDRPIHTLKAHAVAMAELAGGMVADGTRAFVARDRALAEAVVKRDPQLDAWDVAVEMEAIQLIAMLQPEGPDLRLLGAVLKIANCIDRVGRLGYDLARLLDDGPDPPDTAPVDLVRRMGERAEAMFRTSIEAFVAGDAAKAKSVFGMDDEVDAIHREVQQRVFADLPAGGATTLRLARALLAARHLERVGDNACKIAEKTVYAVTGERRPEYFPKRIDRRGGPEGRPAG